jgi:uncharacterized protein YqeY
MDLRAKLTEDMKTAMKSKDTVTLGSVRLFISAIKYREVELRPNPIAEDDILGVLKKLIKQRKESIEQYQAGGRQDLVDSETAELKVLERYLPAQMTSEQIQALVVDVIAALKATSIKDMGPVMKEVIARSAGAADNKLVSTIIKEKLSK